MAGRIPSAVLLMAHGSPDSVDQMEDYLRRVLRRPPSPELVAEFQARYRLIGGRSPLLDVTRRQAKALEARLGARVYVGMRHWNPFIREAVEEARRDGVRRLVALAAAPHFGAPYHRTALEARGDLEVVTVPNWGTEPHLVGYWASRLAPSSTVLFTAHSVPVEHAGSYPEEVRATVRAILDRVPVRAHFAWQSRSPSAVPWLTPEIPDLLPPLRGEEVHVAPVGFVADHVEVLYDLDVLHRGQAEALGIRWRRVPMPNDDPQLIEALAGAVRSHLR